MYRRMTLLLGAALVGSIHAQEPQITAAPRNIVIKRQSATANIEIHQEYAAPIGVDTEYLKIEGSTTKWIGVYTDHLTEETRTTTVGNVATTTVVKPQLAVVTATAASEGVKVGDVTVLIPESLQDNLDALIKEAATSCGGVAKLKSRDGMSCMINAMQGAAQNDQALRLINPAEWEGFALELAGNAPEILSAAVAVLKTQAQKNKFAIMIAAAAAAGVWAVDEATKPIGEAAYKFVFGDGQFGQPKDNTNGSGNDNHDPTSTKQTTTSSSTSSCNPKATVDENSPACDDPDCKGDNKVCQAEGEKKNCPCVKWTKKMIDGKFDKPWADEQQKILQELEKGLPAVIPPQCFRNTHGNGFDGKPRAQPSAFCHCSSAASGGGLTEGNYATMSGEGDKACTYSTMPTQTISITMAPKQTGPVTSCRMESSYSLKPYCTCNDDAMHGQVVTTYLGKVTTVCPDATATMTGIQNGTPTVEPSCYPTHGPDHSNPDMDQLIKLCKAGKPEFAAVCRSDASKDINVDCPGAAQVKRPNPLFDNHYNAWFEKANDAPADCKYLFGQGGSGDDSAVGARVDALCIPAFEAIRDKCTWNGGEVRNQCGTFKYQSCVLGAPCKLGDPSRRRA